jgi:hypothetical protein
VRPGWVGDRGVGMVKDGLGWRHFTSRVVSLFNENTAHLSDPGRLRVGCVPKLGAGTVGQKEHVIFPL